MKQPLAQLIGNFPGLKDLVPGNAAFRGIGIYSISPVNKRNEGTAQRWDWFTLMTL